MPRIRIDEDANSKLEKAVEKLEATKSGLASEFIRSKSEEVLESDTV